jgi:hypothetical protein
VTFLCHLTLQEGLQGVYLGLEPPYHVHMACHFLLVVDVFHLLDVVKSHDEILAQNELFCLFEPFNKLPCSQNLVLVLEIFNIFVLFI